MAPGAVTNLCHMAITLIILSTVTCIIRTGIIATTTVRSNLPKGAMEDSRNI
jgi:hypothetical protein